LSVHLRKVLGNSAWLGGLQLTFQLLPLLTVPIVTRAFGPALFGFVVTATAAAAYVALFVGFGFGWSGPRLIARQHRDGEDSSADVSAILAAQLLIGMAASSIYIMWTLLVRESAEMRFAQWATLATSILTSLVPGWLFLGLDRMRDLVVPQLATRLGATLAIVLLIRGPGDLLLYTMINAMASAVGLVLFLRLLRGAGVRLQRPRFALMRKRVGESASLFVTNAAISVYTTGNVLIVSLLLGNEAAGIFGFADRIRQTTVNTTIPLAQATYPFVCRTTGTDDPSEALARKRMFQIMLVMGSALSAAMFIAAPVAVALLGGTKFKDAVPLVRILAAIPILVVISNLLGVQTLLPRGMDRSVAAIVSLSAVVGAGLQFILTYMLGLKGSAAAYVITEIFVCLAMAAAVTIVPRARTPLTP
jgi:O-antigen/teichoic acid export membrane protein